MDNNKIQSNKERFLQLLKRVNREGMDKLIAYLEKQISLLLQLRQCFMETMRGLWLNIV
ncbi:MAG: hypothetical protein PWP67_1903 [Clostridium butyricum]|nr:hypothetical protein [Clostridium butyricum]